MPWLPAIVLCAASLLFQSGRAHAADPPLLRHQAAPAGHAGEAALAIVWAAHLGRDVAAEHVYQLSRTPLGERLGFEELAAVTRRIGLSAGAARESDRNEAWRRLSRHLKSGTPCLLAVGHPDRWSLATAVDADSRRVSLLDPSLPSPGETAMDVATLLQRWQVVEGRLVWLPLDGRRVAPAPRLDAHSRMEYARKLRSLRRRVEGDEFTMLVERPFVVIGDMSPKDVRRWSEGTVRWAVQRMKAEYFDRDPERILEIWLFDGKESYEKHAKRLFGRKPTTPYGYYSPRDGALVMNIRTGGGTLVHEILHPLMEANFADCPAWFNEGLASLYEQCGDVDGRIRGKTNWRLAGLQRAIAADALPTFEELCGTSSDEFYGDRSGVHYAQARYLCYYLQEHGKLKDFYHAFRAAAGDDPGGHATLAKVVEVDDMRAFQQRWEKYVLSLRFP